MKGTEDREPQARQGLQVFEVWVFVCGVPQLSTIGTHSNHSQNTAMSQIQILLARQQTPVFLGDLGSLE